MGTGNVVELTEISSKYQAVMPSDIRKWLDFRPGTSLVAKVDQHRLFSFVVQPGHTYTIDATTCGMGSITLQYLTGVEL